MNVVLFVKPPVKGFVKKRLAAKLGEEQALKIYTLLLQKAMRAAMGVNARKWLFVAADVPSDLSWVPEGVFEIQEQKGRDLGERMAFAFRQMAERYPDEPVVLIGSDIPAMSADVLSHAFRQISTSAMADVVLGPTEDGGYYLVGLSARRLHDDDCLAALFHNMQWSHAGVLKETLLRLNRLKLSVAFTPVLCDVDEAEDWEKWRLVYEND